MNSQASRFPSRIAAAVAAMVAVALTSILIASGIAGDLLTAEPPIGRVAIANAITIPNAIPSAGTGQDLERARPTLRA